jgi:hypothetical protein
MSVQTKCRCGQPFMIEAEQFPRKVKCHACGQRFNILDTGEIIDLHEVPLEASVSTSIQKGLKVTIPLSNPAAICTDETKSCIAIPSDGERLRQELKLIDLQWEADRANFALFSAFGITIIPTKWMIFLLGVCCLAACFVVRAYLTTLMTYGFLWILGFFPCYLVLKSLYRHAALLEKMEAEWQRKRLAAISGSAHERSMS